LNTFRKKWLIFIVVNILLATPALIIIQFSFQNQKDKALDEISSASTSSFGGISAHMTEHIVQINSLVSYFRRNYLVTEYFNKNKNITFNNYFFKDLKNFLETSKHLYQIRFLDLKGNEKIKVVYKNDKANLVKTLQNKSQHEYFQKISKLSFDQIYLSPIELNKEFEKIEEPHVPVIRIGSPVYNNKNQKIGYLIINYFAIKMIGDFQKEQSLEQRGISIINQEGYFLRGNPEYNFSFEFDKSRKVSNVDKTIWNLITTKEKNELIKINKDYFSYTTYSNFLNKRMFYLVQKIPGYEIEFLMESTYFYSMIFCIMAIVGSIVVSFVLSNLYMSNINFKSKLKEKIEKENLINDLFSNFQKHETVVEKIEYVFLKLQENLKVFQDLKISDSSNSLKQLVNEETHSLFDSPDEVRDKDKKISLDINSKDHNFGVIYLELNNADNIIFDKFFLNTIGKILANEIEEHLYKNENENKKINLMEASKMSSLGVMAGGIAHEINNPMAIIKAASQKIQRKALDPSIIKYSDKISKNITRIQVIVDSMRRLSRNEGNKDKTFLLSEFFLDLNAITNEKLKKHNVIFNVSLQEKDYKLEGDLIQLSQVFLNLISNSIDAMKKSLKREININVYQDLQSLYFSISDTGCGIPEDVKNRIMEPFFTTKDVGQGTGLGLSLSKKIIELMDGELTLDSKSNQTCFIIKLKNFKEINKTV